MATNDNWIYQGRQEHGWFGHGTAPSVAGAEDETDPPGLFNRANAGQRVAWAVNSLIGHVPRDERSSAATRFDSARMERLKATIAAWYASGGLSREAFRDKFLTPYTDDETVDLLRDAAKGMVEARDHDELNAAGADLAQAVQTVGLSASPRYLAEANRRAVVAVEDGEVAGVVKVSSTATDGLLGAAVLGGLLLYFMAPKGTSPPGRAVPAAPTPLPPVIVEAKPDPVPLPEPKEGETPADVLYPDGQLVGEGRKGSRFNDLPGGKAAAEELFDRLTKGGKDDTPDGYPGKWIKLPNGDRIGYRDKSESGPPTIDSEIGGVGKGKIKFPENTKDTGK